MHRYGRRSGFTLIELLIVIAIIGLLATLAVFAVGSARQRARDARRISDIKQISNALELFATSNGGYPSVSRTLGDATNATCLDDGGFHGNVAEADSGSVCGDAGNGTTYMAAIPSNPLPGGVDYVYSPDGSCDGSVCTLYSIRYSLEGGVGEIPSGAHFACQDGIHCR